MIDRHLITRTILVFALVLALCSTAISEEPAPEAPPRDFDSIEALIKLLKAKGVLSDKEAQGFIERYQEDERPGPGSRKVVTIIPEDHENGEYVAKVTKDLEKKLQDDLNGVRNEISQMSDELLRRSRLAQYEREELEKKVTEEVADKLRKSSWAQRIRWGGDVRLRYQADSFDESNADIVRADDPTRLMNTKTDRSRGRVRLRLEAKAQVIDKTEINVGKVEVGARITTGNEDDPVSTNETLGDTLNRDTVVLDRAYVRWKYVPTLPVWGLMPQVTLVGGRFKNPFYSTDLVWDSDVSFEGAAFSLETDTLMSNPWKGFFTIGAFPLQEEELTEKDKWLYGGQMGVRYDKTMGLSAKFGAALYAYRNTVGEPNDPTRPGFTDWTAPDFQQKGNTLIDIDPSADIRTALASEYKLLNLTGTLDYDYWYPVHIMLTADYVENIGFNREDVIRRTGNEDILEETKGYHIKMLVGYPDLLAYGDWNFSLAYKHLESDAVLDAFTDSDFHLGGTNAEGWVLGAGFGLYKNLWLSGRWISSDEIEGPPLSIDTLQIDLNAKF